MSEIKSIPTEKGNECFLFLFFLWFVEGLGWKLVHMVTILPVSFFFFHILFDEWIYTFACFGKPWKRNIQSFLNAYKGLRGKNLHLGIESWLINSME